MNKTTIAAAVVAAAICAVAIPAATANLAPGWQAYTTAPTDTEPGETGSVYWTDLAGCSMDVDKAAAGMTASLDCDTESPSWFWTWDGEDGEYIQQGTSVGDWEYGADSLDCTLKSAYTDVDTSAYTLTVTCSVP